MLSITKEDYLRAIFLLQEDTKEGVRAVDIARYLHLSKSTVSERLQELAAKKLIVSPKYGAVTFTKRGYAIASNLTRKHRLIEVFLMQVLHVPRGEVHAEAHALEHALSDSVAARLGKFLGNPTLDPHGKHIPLVQ